MALDNQILDELKRIRESQEQLLAEYRQFKNEALSIQKQSFEIQKQSFEIQKGAVAQQAIAVTSQLKFARLYRVVIAVIAIVIGLLIYKLFSLL